MKNHLETLYYILFVIFLVTSAFFILGRLIFEPALVMLMGRPVANHVYIRKKEMETQYRDLIAQHYIFYRKLTTFYKKAFEHRVEMFLAEYQFEGRGEFVMTNDVRYIIAANYVRLTFGMNYYLIDSLQYILVYPDAYRSPITGEWYEGDYGPAYRTVAFSWKKFMEGIAVDNNNIDLGIHEFAHAVYFSLSRQGTGQISRSFIFMKQFEDIDLMLEDKKYFDQLKNSDYFRQYAFVSRIEFISVILECFFETPEIFRHRFPELYKKVKNMISYREGWFQNSFRMQ